MCFCVHKSGLLEEVDRPGGDRDGERIFSEGSLHEICSERDEQL